MMANPDMARTQGREVLAGLVRRVTYHNAETGYCVLRVKVRGRRDLETVVGTLPAVAEGEAITASGEWVKDRKYGPQFRARFLRTSRPTSIEGIRSYLASGQIHGIGEVYADKLVRAFGEDVFDVIEFRPEELRKVDGIGPVRADSIRKVWAEQKTVREIMVFLHEHGVSTARATRIFTTYGADAVQVMSENPYRVAQDIRGMGFKSADAIAMKLGIARTAMIRVRSGIGFVLAEALDDGHCGLPRDRLVTDAAELLGVSEELVLEALEHELREESLLADTVDDTECIFLSVLHHAESRIAERLRRLLRGRCPWPEIDAGKAIPWAERRTGLELADSQREAVRTALRSKVMVITGGPGVGKTTIVNTILSVLAAKKVRIALCAPTGRAAKRMSEATGRDAKTVHRLLEVDPRHGGFRRDADLPLECDFLVIDEMSMVDVMLMDAVLGALPPKAGLLVVGDVDQLPSVGPGQVLADMIESGVLPVASLVEVFRQAAESRIVVNAHRINRGEAPDFGKPDIESDFLFLQRDTPEEAARTIVNLVRNRIPGGFGLDPLRDIQVLCPMVRGTVGARELNSELQKAINPAGERRIEHLGYTFAPGDKVMQTENDYDNDVYNGDIGIVRDIVPDAGEIVVAFDGRRIVYGGGDLDALVPAYATTIHKAQGSEYPAVVVPVTTQHYIMLQRNLLYTAVTRGRRLVVLVGQERAVQIAVDAVSGRRRWSRLRGQLETARAG